MSELRTVTIRHEQTTNCRATECNLDFCHREAPQFVRVGDLCLWLCGEHFEKLDTRKHGVKP